MVARRPRRPSGPQAARALCSGGAPSTVHSDDTCDGRRYVSRRNSSSGAVITGQYRYLLWRTIEAGDPARRLLFVMLNPSTADGSCDDPTLRRCLGFAASWNYGALEVCNLFAYRSTDPGVLTRVGDPVGRSNNAYILGAARRATTVVAAWGARGALLERASVVTGLLTRTSDVLCLGTTKDGAPLHPLYVPGAAVPQRYAACR